MLDSQHQRKRNLRSISMLSFRYQEGRAPMAQVLVRDLDPDVLERLKSRAKLHGRSLQGELKTILEAAAVYSMSEARQVSEHSRRRLAGRPMSDSGELLREDRDR